jgi:hypothetical protein
MTGAVGRVGRVGLVRPVGRDLPHCPTSLTRHTSLTSKPEVSS